MALLAHLYDDRQGGDLGGRHADRHSVALDATVRPADRQPADALIDDLSVTGFRMTTTRVVEPGATVSIGIAGLGRRDAAVVWRRDQHYGCRFLEPLDQMAVIAASTGRTPVIVTADFGWVQPPAERADPPLDAFERKVRMVRGPVLALGLVIPWAIIAGMVHLLM